MNQLGLAEWWSKMLDKEHRRCHVPSKICREIGDCLIDAMLGAEPETCCQSFSRQTGGNEGDCPLDKHS